MTKTTKQQRKRRLALAIGAAAVVGGLAWLWAGIDDAPAPTATAAVEKRSATIEAAEHAAERRAILDARRDARTKLAARKPAAAPVLPEHPPPLGLPPTATKLPAQPDQRMPVPRGSYD